MILLYYLSSPPPSLLPSTCLNCQFRQLQQVAKVVAAFRRGHMSGVSPKLFSPLPLQAEGFPPSSSHSTSFHIIFLYLIRPVKLSPEITLEAAPPAAPAPSPLSSSSSSSSSSSAAACSFSLSSSSSSSSSSFSSSPSSSSLSLPLDSLESPESSPGTLLPFASFAPRLLFPRLPPWLFEYHLLQPFASEV